MELPVPPTLLVLRLAIGAGAGSYLGFLTGCFLGWGRQRGDATALALLWDFLVITVCCSIIMSGFVWVVQKLGALPDEFRPEWGGLLMGNFAGSLYVIAEVVDKRVPAVTTVGVALGLAWAVMSVLAAPRPSSDEPVYFQRATAVDGMVFTPRRLYLYTLLRNLVVGTKDVLWVYIEGQRQEVDITLGDATFGVVNLPVTLDTVEVVEHNLVLRTAGRTLRSPFRLGSEEDFVAKLKAIFPAAYVGFDSSFEFDWDRTARGKRCVLAQQWRDREAAG